MDFPDWEGLEAWEDGTADKGVNFQVDDKQFQMPEEAEFRVAELLAKAGSGLFKQLFVQMPVGLRGWQRGDYCDRVLQRS